jgi:glycosyltransferase involved in cell wall biosynthesis
MTMRLAINGWFWHSPATGSGQTVRYLVPALVEQDPRLEIALIAPDGEKRPPDDLPDRVQWVPAAVHSGALGKLWFEQVTFPRLCRRLRAEVAHVPYFASPLEPSVPTVVTVHDLIPMVLPAYRGGPLVRFYTALVAAAAGRARLVLADSEASRRDILARLGVAAARVRVIYLAPAPHYRPVSDADRLAEVRHRYELPEAFALWLSGFDVRKNAAAVLHAYTWVSEALRGELPLVMAGALPVKDTPFFPNPRRMVAELGIQAAVCFPGWIDEADKPALYSAARLFVYPSRYEGFGLPILEAMACGTPVVTSTAASLPELAGTAAFQIDPDDTRQLAAAIVALGIQDDLHQQLREEGLERAARFTWKKTAAETLAAYRAALD